MNFKENSIPIIIPCYKNVHYVKHMIRQLKALDSTVDIVILNNSSEPTDQFPSDPTIRVFDGPHNEGPWVTPMKNKSLYDLMPSMYIVTDADLQLNENMPPNFLVIMRMLALKHNTYKLGLALDISTPQLIHSIPGYADNKDIVEFEKRYWTKRVPDLHFELYEAAIDSTFALLNKNIPVEKFNLRIAGNFTARHMPWYVDNPLSTLYQDLQQYYNTEWSITGRSFLKRLQDRNIMAIQRRHALFMVHRNEHEQFWRNYSSWENHSFDVYEKYLKQDGIMLDIGAWNGCTSLFARTLCKRVYAVEADRQAVKTLKDNIALNDAENDIVVINRAIYHRDHQVVMFGHNNHLPGYKPNDSTSQIQTTTATSTSDANVYLVQTITLETMLSQYNIDPHQLCLVKVDIEGGEENILTNLWALKQQYKFTLYVEFHFSWWKFQNLDRFTFLTPAQKSQIETQKFCSIVFE